MTGGTPTHGDATTATATRARMTASPRPAVVAVAISVAAIALVAWPTVVEVLWSRPADATVLRVDAALAAAALALGGVSCLWGSRVAASPSNMGWAIAGAGALAGAFGMAIAAFSVSPESSSAQLALTAGGTACLVVGSLFMPSDLDMTALRRIDLGLVLCAVLAVVWAVVNAAEASFQDTGNAGTALAVLAAGALLSSWALVVRSLPQHNSALRGYVVALGFAGIAMFLGPTLGNPLAATERMVSFDAMLCVVGLAMAASGARVRRPHPEGGGTELADRVQSLLPVAATVVGLATIAVHQRLEGSLDPMMIALGIAVVVLSGTRGALMHEHNALLVEQLATTADDLARTARTDELTGLGNRYGLEQRLERALAAAPGTGITVYFIDIDNFKEVNDSLGHAAGDTLLRVLAERLTGVLGNDVYRVGGDEFVAVREDLDLNAAEALAAGVVAALGPPVRIGTHGVLSGASVGLARSELREDRGRRPDEPELLLRRADLALYRAKELGRGQWAAYQPWLQERADRRLAIQRGLPAALADGQLEVHYQPIVSLGTGEMLGAEALARLATDRFGMLMPGEFLPLAQEAGLLAEVRSQVLAKVVDRLATSDIAWLAVNLAASEPVPADLPGEILDALSGAGVHPSRLRLEVTETTVLDPGSRVRLAHLAESGVQVCIEDFGTGPTSLRHLSGMGDLTLKLDRSFIGGLGRGHDDRLVIAAVVDLAHDLELRVGVEAVTTLHQAEDLRALGVEEAQGWVFGQPVPWDRLPFAPLDRPRVEHR